MGGALVDDEEGDVVFAHFAGDGGEGGLGCHFAVEEFVGFFDDDDEGAGFGVVLGVVAEGVGGVFPDGADLAGEDV